MDEQNILVQSVSEAFRMLLSEKHLYQSTKVELTEIDAIATKHHEEACIHACGPTFGGGGHRAAPPLQHFLDAAREPILHAEWIPSPEVKRGLMEFSIRGRSAERDGKLSFTMPTIRTTCDECGTLEPFNSIAVSVENGRDSPANQWFFATYECQACKTEPVRFLIRRAHTKLILCGRDPIESVAVPKIIPKASVPHYRDALHAYQCGITLGGVFHLRVLIEQYWKGISEVAAAVKDVAKPTGEQLGVAYKATLPIDFKQRFPNLHETYDELSEAMHAAKAAGPLFEKCHSQILKHFQAREVFGLTEL